ncbi:hypothetical protein GALMADRAFT_213725 [Galerina marginata CBS 339.88]|uniref:Uncharacterized protein n=1 Tax=Galerina marginata (strain CBS 339.88) TaxID=685588 RepID=A0A067SW43_GALM3|nr:hypothetical protein GALMADRAFT_213725 [Galerina marginata CBS 339.88]
MKFAAALFIALIPALGLASPVGTTDNSSRDLANRALGATGSYTVSGLGARKKQLIACGATVLDLAIAMLETERMSTDYKYGDGKSSDSANFGVFKQNWGMLRSSTGRYKGKTANDYNTGAELNSNLCLDISLRHESMNYYGEGTWFAGHRNGASGLSNPNTQDIQNYKDGVYWIRNQLQYTNSGKDMTSDVRYWVDVPAI